MMFPTRQPFTGSLNNNHLMKYASGVSTVFPRTGNISAELQIFHQFPFTNCVTRPPLYCLRQSSFPVSWIACSP